MANDLIALIANAALITENHLPNSGNRKALICKPIIRRNA